MESAFDEESPGRVTYRVSAPPAAPTDLAASARSQCAIELTWTDNANDETGFRVERSVDGVSFTQIASVGANVTRYTSRGLTAGAAYFYRVRAYVKGSPTLYSAYAQTASPTTTLPALAAPTLAIQRTYATQADLSWSDDSASESGFKIERSADGATFVEVASVGADVTTYTDAGLAQGTAVTYRVRPYNACGAGPASNAASTTTTTCGAPADADGRGLWVWSYDQATKPGLLAFAAGRSVSAIYVESEALVAAQPATLTDLVQSAAAQNLKVELLFGAPSWARAASHEQALALARASVSYVQSLSGAKPTAVHFDVEPYLLPEWNTDRNGIANQYLDLLEGLAQAVAGSGLALAVDVPFWYDTVQVTRAGATRPLHKWVLDLVDRVVIMDYRDFATGGGGLIDLAASELGYAEAVCKQAVVGVETQCNLGDQLTFCEEGEGAMNAALGATRQAYVGNVAMAGVAVHYYESWQLLAP